MSKNRFLSRVQRRPLKSITILPSLVTLINGILGFSAIVLASTPIHAETSTNTHYSLASYFILFAMIADMLDGRLARMSQTTSSFGGQLDSLCDMISFGVAPAFIMLKVLQQYFPANGPGHSELMQRFLWLAALAYISCTAIRLARFNVENVDLGSAHMAFVGLPSPAAAGVLVSFVLFHQEMIPQWSRLLWILPVLAFSVGILMVSRIPYPHVVNYYLRGKKPFGYLIKVLLFIGLVWWNPQTALLLVFVSFAASGLIRTLHQHFRVKHAAPVTVEPPPQPSPEASAL
jgi:CDP-diacylglycerol--serine O-phosphatidyltransferase